MKFSTVVLFILLWAPTWAATEVMSSETEPVPTLLVGGQTPNAPLATSPLNLGSIHIGALYASAADRQGTLTGGFQWTPYYSLSPETMLRLGVGASILKNTSASGFLALSYQVFAGYLFAEEWLAEGGVGIQAWLGNGGVAPMTTVNFGYRPVALLSEMIERIYVGYSYIPRTGATSHQVQFGIGLGI